jgi:hypothetical protein
MLNILGLGQRLLGAASSNNNVTYIGCDPWTKAIETNKKILEYLCEKDKSLKKRFENFYCVN